MLDIIKDFIGFHTNKAGHVEKLVSGLGGFVGILMILLITRLFLHGTDAVLIVASMGASAVLLFAVPHGPLSQPWAVFGGHLISAFIGVSCYFLIPNLYVAAAAAVGLAISAMYYLRCIHPPGGATALTAVVAGAGLHQLGYQYLLTPVLLNVVIILLVAVLFNYPFQWRRYPLYFQKRLRALQVSEGDGKSAISHSDYIYAMEQLDSYIDISEFDLERIYHLARQHAASRQLSMHDIRLGHYYSNGQYGDNWGVRQIVDDSPDEDSEKDEVIYKIVAGPGRRRTGCVTRAEFARWARHEVIRDEENWKRVNTDQQDDE